MTIWFGDVAGIDLNAMAGGSLIETLGIEIVRDLATRRHNAEGSSG